MRANYAEIYGMSGTFSHGLKNLVFACCLWLGSAAIVLGQPGVVEDSVDKDYSSELPRVPPQSPEEALASFEVLDGFEVELVAAEPLVVDPVAFAFDAHERLFVVEMRDYSEQATEHLGRVALLEDTNADGRMDRRTTFVEGLSWPTALWPWQDGVLVAEPPRLTWYRDTDGDGVSDMSQDWFVGFGRDNVQGLVNSLRWGLDGYIHGAVSSSGAELEQLASGIDEKIMLGRRDFAIDPLRKTLQPVSGGGQHGLSFNRWGDKFVTSNSDHLQQVLDLDTWLAEHPSKVRLPSLRRSIAEDGPQAEVFRASPIEPWRIVRTRLRVSGVAPGIVEGGGRPAGYFTGATGTWIMDSEAGFGDANYDTALVCDVGSNLVHRKRLIDHGLYWSGERMYPATELLRSSDIWFRPVQLGDGPDGALYIADMYREVIEHPKSLPPMIKQHLDLTSGRDRGRIWRLKAKRTSGGSESGDLANGPSKHLLLADLPMSELVDQLRNQVAWKRRMASQLLIEKRALTGATQIIGLALSDASPAARVLAMNVADRLGTLQVEHIQGLLTSPHPRIVAAALELARKHQWGSFIHSHLDALAQRPEPRVQLQLAMLSADLEPPDSKRVLQAMLAAVGEPTVRAVWAVAAGDRSWELFARQQDTQSSLEGFDEWLNFLLPVWADNFASDPELRDWMVQELTDSTSPRQPIWLDSLSILSNQQQVDGILNGLAESARSAMTEQVERALENQSNDVRNVRWIRLLESARQVHWVARLLEPTQTQPAQAAIINVVDASNAGRLNQVMLSAIPSMTPGLQGQALRVLIKRIDSAEDLLAAVEAGKVKPSQIAPDLRQQLLGSKSEALANRAATILGQATQNRRAVIDEYVAALNQWQNSKSGETKRNADREQGRLQFQRVCAQCHRVSGIGHDVGAALTQLSTKSAQQLLESILDPNREVDPRYSGYSVLLQDGRVLTGVIREETASQLELVASGGEVFQVNRGEIDQIKSTGLSLMPTGIEEQLTPAQMADLIDFLQTVGLEVP